MFYDTFFELCSQKGVTPNKACVDCEISRTSVAKWKKGSTLMVLLLRSWLNILRYLLITFLVTNKKKAHCR